MGGLNIGSLEFDFGLYGAGVPPKVDVIRSEDQLLLQIEFINMEFRMDEDSQCLPCIAARENCDSFIIIHLQPQSIAEQAFFETSEEFPDVKSGSKDGSTPHPDDVSGKETEIPQFYPVKRRLSGPSRLVFRVPHEMEPIPYTIESILALCSELELVVVPTALPAVGEEPEESSARVKLGTLAKRISVVDYALRAGLVGGIAAGDGVAVAQEIAPIDTVPKTATGALPLEQLIQRARLETWKARSGWARDVLCIPGLHGTKLGPEVFEPPLPAELPRLQKPTDRETAIEFPWRLILSPNRYAAWVHATKPVTHTDRTELWHTRLAKRSLDGIRGEFSKGLKEKTVRAVWSKDKTFNTGNTLLHKGYPVTVTLPKHHPAAEAVKADDPLKADDPFRTSLDANDRQQIVHLSSNHYIGAVMPTAEQLATALAAGAPNPTKESDYPPQPIDTQHLMLSPMGAWASLRGAWSPPTGLSVEEWRHRATMGRDHFARVVYKGYLFPFGHRASLIKVTERKLQEDPNDSKAVYAILRQRMYIVVRSPTMEYLATDDVMTAAKNSYSRQFPFLRATIHTLQTPNLESPGNGLKNEGQNLFVPKVGEKAFRFNMTLEDLEGNTIDMAAPLIFVSTENELYRKKAVLESVANRYEDPTLSTVSLELSGQAGQTVAFCEASTPGDTAFETVTLTFGAEIPDEEKACDSIWPGTKDSPQFYPKLRKAGLRIPAVTHLIGNRDSTEVEFFDTYLAKGFPDKGKNGSAKHDNCREVFLRIVAKDGLEMSFEKQGDRCGALATPSMAIRGLSRQLGPVCGDLGKLSAGNASTMLDGFLDSAKVLGAFTLKELVYATGMGDDLNRLPRFITEAVSASVKLITTIGRLRDGPALLLEFYRQQVKEVEDHVVKKVRDALKIPVEKPSPLDELKTKADALATRLDALVTLLKEDVESPDLAVKLKNLGTKLQELKASLEDAKKKIESIPADSLSEEVRKRATSCIDSMLKWLPVAIDVAKAETLRKLRETSKKLLGELGRTTPSPESVANLVEELRDEHLQEVRRLVNALRRGTQSVPSNVRAVARAIDWLLDALGTLPSLLSWATDLLAAFNVPEEISVHYEWSPELQDALGSTFQAKNRGEKASFTAAVDVTAKSSLNSEPSFDAHCSLRNFSLNLLGTKPQLRFLVLRFKAIEFIAGSRQKPDINVEIDEIEFAGVLSFVEALKNFIPLDGFSDPPALDVSSKGINASFSLALPNIPLGMFCLENLSLGAELRLPFVGDPLSVRFRFCERHSPFLLSVSMFGGGGFFAITLNPNGLVLLEAALEFGANISVSFGVASGGVSVMAGIYFKMKKQGSAFVAELTGYLRMRGEVDVLGLISASIELYLDLKYQSATGKVVGRASLKIEVEVFLFSTSVTLECERKFAGSSGDPKFRAVMAPYEGEVDLPDPWPDYCEAFA